ncbi:unnamed protein product [Adineta steineri]|uniref:Microsomal glutathione S-transferase 1 n=1 Tax=Adineta steineri TaxID=433720 RepID=A0A818G5V9_9BILA|nr:unnamed protein product [Adineta steineri]CAF3486394.1 unnamed protein product [Adineta steineri]
MVTVNTIQAGTVFAWFMLVVILRRIVMLGVSMAARRGKPFPPGTRPPEDNKLIGQPTTTTTQHDFPRDVRVNRTINNDTENDPYFIILLLATAIFSDTAVSPRNCTRTIVYGILYLFIRIVYAVAYIMALQPWRSIMFGLGLVLTLACSLDLVITMSGRPN